MEHLTKDQLRTLFRVASAHNHRDYLAIRLGYEHALRISEVCALTPNNFRDGFIIVQRLKGSQRTTQPLMPETRPLIEEWLQPFRSHQRIFNIQRSQLSKLFERYSWEAGIPQHLRHFHIAKHSCAMHSIGTGIENVRQYLGHKSISSTGQYLRVDDTQASHVVQAALV